MSIESLNEKFNRLNTLANGLGLDANDWTVIDGWQKKAREAIVRDNLADNEGMIAFLDYIRTQINDINEVLLYKKELSVDERNRLFDRREWGESLIKFFKVTKSTIESINNQVDENLAHLNNLTNQ